MKSFELMPWELPTACVEPLVGQEDARVEVAWRGRNQVLMLRRIQLKSKEACCFAREASSKRAGNWMILTQRRGLTWPWLPENYEYNAVNIAKHFEAQSLILGRFCVVVDGTTPRRAVTLESGQSTWVGQSLQNQESFDVKVQPKLFISDAEVHPKIIQEALNDRDSDARFAISWLRYSFEKQRHYVHGRARWNELKTVARWFVVSAHRLWQSEERCIWDLSQHAQRGGLFYCPNSNLRHLEKEPIIVQMAHFLLEHFAPPLDEFRFQEHRCVRNLVSFNSIWPFTDVENPTAHERMEAALNLRDWLRQNDAPAELLALLAR